MFRRLLILSALLSVTLLGCKAAPEKANAAGGPGESLPGDDCYVQLFDGEEFDALGDSFMLSEPGDYASLRELPGAGMDWTNEADSLRVGSATTVISWSETNFEGNSTTYEAGSEHPKVVNQPASLQLSCT